MLGLVGRNRWFLALGGLLVSGTAAAEPAVLYVPDVDIELFPVGAGSQCSGLGGQDHSGRGCTGVVDAPTVQPAYPGSAGLVSELEVSLAPYDVHLTQVRPPEYLPYTMLLPSDAPNLDSQSFTCTAGGTNCGARKRNDIVFTYGSTQQCPVSDPLHAALFAFGAASGLEGISLEGGVMSYLPDYTMPASSYLAACSPRVQPLGINDAGEPVPLPLACAGVDHVGCPAGEQAGQVELIERYGPRVVDLDPPQFANISPADGEYFDPSDQVRIDVDISDADPILGVRWTITSPELVDFGYPDGIDMCTNDVCLVGFDGNPSAATDGDWAVILSGMPEGEYQAVLEASDFHGNVAAMVVHTFFISTDGPPPPATTTDPGGTFGDTLDGDDLTDGGEVGGTVDPTNATNPGSTSAGSGLPPNDDATGDDAGAADDGLVDHGCACRSHPGGRRGLPWLLGVALLLGRRRSARVAAQRMVR